MVRSAEEFVDSLQGSSAFAEVVDKFEQHIIRLEDRASLADAMYAKSLPVPKDAALPRKFTRSEPDLIEALERQVEALAQASVVISGDVRNHIASLWVKPLLEKRGCTLSGKAVPFIEKNNECSRIMKEVPGYSAFQLAVLLRQIHLGTVDIKLVAELRSASDGRNVTLDQITRGEVSYKDIFEVGRLLGNIDIVHTHSGILVHLLMYGAERLSSAHARARVHADIVRLGYLTGSRHVDYNEAIQAMMRNQS